MVCTAEKNKQGIEDGERMGNSILKEVYMVGFTETVIFEQRQEGSGNSQVNRCEENIPGRGT